MVTEPLSRLGAEVLGIDASERNVMVAQRHARLSGAQVRYRHALPEDCLDQAGSFDAVISLEVVEHVADVPAFLEALARLVVPSRFVLIDTRNRALRSYVKAIVGAESVPGGLPPGTHDWRKFATPAGLDRGLWRYGFEVAGSGSVVFNPLTMRRDISRDLSTNCLQFHRRVSCVRTSPGVRVSDPVGKRCQ